MKSLEIAAAFAAVFAAFLIKLLRIGRREKGLPPGPPTVPILGNLHLFPKEHGHHRFSEWARQYGDVYSLKLANKNYMIVSSASSVKELLDNRGAVSADRPSIHAVNIIADGLYLSHVGAKNPVYRQGRRAMRPLLNAEAVQRLRPLQRAEIMRLLYDFYKTPEKFYTHILRLSVSIMVFTIYGKHSPSYDSAVVQQVHDYTRTYFGVIGPGALPPVDFLPILQLVPERWATWKTKCKQVREMQRKLFYGLFEECESRMSRGHLVGCYMEDVIPRKDELGFTDRDMLVYHAGILLDGGTDTSAAIIRSLVLMLVAFPEVQRKGREEIDAVIGDDRLPTFDDIANLRYVYAIIRETHRFRPASRAGVPHVTTVDQQYKGFAIPKGTSILMNIWGIFHDPDIFDKPEEFIPERFLLAEHGTKPGVDDSAFRATFPFGAGRRLCPGYHLANNTIALATMCLLWAFEFHPAKDKATGQPIFVDTDNYDIGVTSMPLSFPCEIVPRSKKRMNLLVKEFEQSFPELEEKN